MTRRVFQLNKGDLAVGQTSANTQQKQCVFDPRPDTAAKADYRVQISSETEDPSWDTFVTKTPGGHHTQTSMWARVKATLGWRVKRLTVRQGGRIVGGAQVLMRQLPIAGAVGYVSKGPLFATYDPQLMTLVIDELKQVAKACRIQYLAVQPPDNGQAVAQQLPACGFQPSIQEPGVTATVKLDLAPDLDAILSQMKSKTRHNIRFGLHKGVTVREGGEQDLPTFYQALLETGRRLGFAPYPEAYFGEMWRILEPPGHVKLFLAEYRGEVLSTLMVIPFGDTVICKKATWCGQHGEVRPNQVIHWAAIQWSRSQGYRYFDFEGIDRPAATRLLAGESLPASALQTPTRFKLGFGGWIMLLPIAYDYVYNPFLSWAHGTVYPKISHWSVVQNALEYLRKR